MKSPKTSRRHKLLAFAPALVVIGITALTASGMSVVSGATAASTVGVTGTVATAGSADPDLTGGDCADDGTNETLLAGFDAAFRATDGCNITFYTNNGTGANVTYADALGNGTFFCSDSDVTAGVQLATRDCSLDVETLDNVLAGNSTIADGSDKFGLALMAVSGGGGAVAGANVSAADALPTGADAIWWPITTTPGELCTTSGPNTSTTLANCQFALGGSGEGATQAAGDYFGQLSLVLTQN